MPIQPTPPIQLDPSMDNGHQLAFTNQNFNNIASVIGQNSFVIIQSGTASIQGDDNSGGTTWKIYSQTIAHNLGYKPAVMGFVESTGTQTDGLGTSNYRRPTPTAVYTLTVTAGWPQLAYAEVLVNETNVICRWLGNPGSNWTSVTVAFKYYLLQQTAN